MNARRDFLKLAQVAGAGAAVAVVSGGQARAQGVGNVVGSWSTIHTLPFPPGSFREFLSFSLGGVVHETNSFLHTASNLDFSAFGLPNVLNASDGVGNWAVAPHGDVRVVFRKMLFNGSRENFGDLHVTGTVRTEGAGLQAEWHIEVVNPAGVVLVDLGPATSQGSRLT
jgi:hypothetical protein